jgi:ribosomal protein L11 methyltransferase
VSSSPALVLHFPTSTTPAVRDRLVALLADHGLLAIEEDDLIAPRTWRAHFPDAGARAGAAAAVSAESDLRGTRLELEDVPDEDWARRTQADLPAIRVGRIVVAPPWDAVSRGAAAAAAPADSPDAELVVVIEPSRGFGTGHHESTRLCLVLLQGRDVAGRTALDVGTGSGVLAIAAAKLGAAAVRAIDNDPDAIENARENIARNDVSRVVDAHVRDFTEGALPPADVVTANLTGTAHARFARQLSALVRPGGVLVVAGFTEDEREMVGDAFAPYLSLTESAEEAGWWAYAFSRT